MSKEEPSYCADHLIECGTTIVPLFSQAMSSGDFPWLHAIVAVVAMVSFL